MPEEIAGVKESPVSPAPAAESPQGPAPSTPRSETPNADDPNAPTIPRARLNKEIEAKRRLEQKVQQLEQREQQWAQWYQHQQQSAARPAHSNGTSSAGEVDTTEALIRQQLGDDEAGKKAYDTLEKFFAHKLGKTAGQFATKDEMQKAVQAAVGGLMGQLNSTFRTSNRFQKWVADGMITQDEAQTLQGTLNEYIQQYPQLTQSPENMDFMVSHLLTQAMESGEIKPFSQPRPRNPLQPGRHGAAAAEPKEPEWNPDQTRFARLRGLDPKAVKKLRDMSVKNYKGATE